MSSAKTDFIQAFKGTIPWWVKVVAKLILSRLPVDYRHWKKIRLFEHGRMDEPGAAFAIFERHFNFSNIVAKKDFTVLELGPGDSLYTALIARAFGASSVFLVDVGAFATEDIKRYQGIAKYLNAQGLDVPNLHGIGSKEELLALCNSTYLTKGLASLRVIPDESVDFVFSNAVLEHIRKRNFSETMHELWRVLCKGGCASHRVDLKDHLGGGLNNLRFSERVWESDLMAKAGFYTNRIRYSEMLQLFKQTGFTVEVKNVRRWRKLPIPRKSIDKEFQGLTDDELIVSGFEVIMHP